MKKWFAAGIIMLAPILSPAADNWVAAELKEASAQLDKRQFAQAFEICHNLLLVNCAAALNRDAADDAKFIMAAAGRRVKAGNPKAFSEDFLARAKRLGFVQAGCAWMPAEAKSRLSTEASAKLDKIAHAADCTQCKGACVTACPNCQDGKAKCLACNGTGRSSGGGAFARTQCPVCSGRGKSECTFCRGTGCVVCPKCSGVGVCDQ